MRLLRVKDWLFEDGTPDRKYAILSHTWIQEASEEVYYPDIRDIALRSDEENALLKGRRGWSKVSNTVAQAVRDGLEYVWIDTCCIDQKNPTELTTSINSMFEWYAKATVCYVYLEDVFKTATPSQIDFSKARWSTRGWTLQELIAPKSVIFFDATWDLLSTRADSACDLSRVTSIDEEVLRDGPNNLSAYSVAKRMSWAAGRCTSRPEDRAYSLFGIFGITMPTHYGEGGKNAFVRLQEEIIKYSDDQSLFAWNDASPSLQAGGQGLLGYPGSGIALLLAPSPDHFEGRGHIIRNTSSAPTAFYMSNRGLEIDLPGYRTFDFWQETKAHDRYRVLLDCRSVNSPFSVFLLNLQPSGPEEYCVVPTPEGRCTEVDWSEFRKKEKVEKPPRRKIVIRREADLAPALGQVEQLIGATKPMRHTKLRLELPSWTRRHQSQSGTPPPEAWIHSAYPQAFWNKELKFCQPVSDPGDRRALRMDAHLRVPHIDRNNVASTYDVHVMFKYGPDTRQTFADVHGIEASMDGNYQILPAVRIAAHACDDRDTQMLQHQGEPPDTGHENAAGATMIRFKEDPLIHSLPLTKFVWANNKLAFRVTLNKDDVLSESFWVAKVDTIDCSTLWPYIWYTLLVPLMHGCFLVIFGWDISNILMNDTIWDSFISSNFNYSITSMVNLYGIFNLPVGRTPLVWFRSCLVYISAPLLAAHINNNNTTRIYYRMWNTTPKALAGVDPLYKHIRASFGTSIMYRQWELTSFFTYVMAFSQTSMTWREGLIDVLWVTLLRDGILVVAQPRLLRAGRIVVAWLLMSFYERPEWQIWVRDHIYGVVCVAWFLGIVLGALGRERLK